MCLGSSAFIQGCLLLVCLGCYRCLSYYFVDHEILFRDGLLGHDILGWCCSVDEGKDGPSMVVVVAQEIATGEMEVM